jgi:hypothetical protein
MELILLKLLQVIALIGLFISSLHNHSNVKKVINIIKEKNKIKREYKIKNYPLILINIPVFKESKILNETLDHFSRLEYPLNKLIINIITTEKENNLKTFIKAKELVHIHNNRLKKRLFRHIHYPFKKGRKAHQLNFALKKELNSLNSRMYVATYDADSRPNLKTLLHLAEHVNKDDYFPVYQQLSLYFKNFNEIGYINKAVALFQSRWTFSYEFKTYFQELKSKKGLKKTVATSHSKKL